MFKTNEITCESEKKWTRYLVRGIASLALIGAGTALTLYGKSVWKNRKS